MQSNLILMYKSISQTGIQKLRTTKWGMRRIHFMSKNMFDIHHRELKNIGSIYNKCFRQHKEKMMSHLGVDIITNQSLYTTNRYVSQGLLPRRELVKKKKSVCGWNSELIEGTTKKYIHVSVRSLSNGNIKVAEDSVDMGVDKKKIDFDEVNANKRTHTADSQNAIVADPNKYTMRSHNCGQLNESHIDENVRIMGWLLFKRKNLFLILGDRYGRTQLLIPDSREDLRELAETMKLESVIFAEGRVHPRPPGQENPKMSTGFIEVVVSNLKILNMSERLPFTVKEKNVDEFLRLKFRYLDLRHNEVSMNNLVARSDVTYKMRRFLIEHLNFVEVETPTLFKRTPGGAREFAVLTSVKGEYYSLVQSPQQFKQMLMVGTVDRYFQIARCYRDEKFRSDRQPEFTQLDIEMSFCDQEGVMALVEDLLKYVWPKDLPPLVTPFPRLPHKVATTVYGTDKPDLRFDWKLNDLKSMIVSEFHHGEGRVKLSKYLSLSDFSAYAFVARKGGIKLTGKKRVQIETKAKSGRPDCWLVIYRVENGPNEKLDYLFNPQIAEAMKRSLDCEPDDVIFVAFGPEKDVLALLGEVRVSYAHHMEESGVPIRRENEFNFVWIVDFPMFEFNDGVLVSSHHPFTQPHPDDTELLDTEPLKMRGLNYDLVVNGAEIGGGSIRIHDSELQKKIIEDILKLELSNFSHMIEALSLGAPVHGGIALGIDRLLAVMCGARSLRDVIAFPKITNGRDPISGAPGPLSEEEKAYYHLQ